MDTRFDQINEKINKNHKELREKIKQTSDNLTSMDTIYVTNWE